MSDSRIDDYDERLRKVEQVTFNGVQAAVAKMSRWLDEKAPHLMTREEHAKIDEDQGKVTTEANRVIGKKKDRRLTAIGMVVPFVTAMLTAGFMKLMGLL